MAIESFKPTSTLVATLGSEPQVITATIDLLRSRGVRLHRAWILHTSPPDGPIVSAVNILKTAASQEPYRSLVEIYLVPIDDDGGLIPDLDTPARANAGFRKLYQLVREAKLAGEEVHLSIAGGRKNLTAYAMVTAQLLFDDRDCVWHLYSSGEFLASKRLHPQAGDDVHLVPVPVLLRDYISPALTLLRHIADPFEALNYIQRANLEHRVKLISRFIDHHLTPAERRTVSLLAMEGSGDQEIAAQLNLSPRTVEQQLRSAYAKAADFWQMESVGRAQLIAMLHTYFSLPNEQH